MYVPVFNDIRYVNDEGFLTEESQIYNDELNQTLRNNLSDDGWVFPSITASNLAIISTQMPDGTGWYETDAKEIVFKINGALRKVTTTSYP